MSSVQAARIIVDELIRLGVREAVLAPGSRNAPLSYALYDAERAGRLRLHVRIDERTGAFLALGLAKASGVPVPMVCTSGTAVANLHPAVLEASHSGIPLIALTADRPADLFGSGANQTTEQAGLFGPAARWSVTVSGELRGPALRSAIDRALGWAVGAGTGDPGPVQINAAFAEPLVPAPGDDASDDAGAGAGAGGRPAGRPWTDVSPLRPAVPLGSRDAGDPAAAIELPLTDRTLLVAGDAPTALGAAAAAFADRNGLPVLSEPSSGAWGSAIASAPLLLGADWLAEHRPDQAVVVGHPTLSRPVRQLLSDARVATIAVTQTPRWADGSLAMRAVHPAAALAGGPSPTEGAGGEWLRAWRRAGGVADAAVGELLAGDDAWPSSVAAARELLAALPVDSLLFLGSSSAVRDVEIAATPRADVTVLANRGLAGIDGTLSTALGAALATGRRACLLVGDLTLLHDANALVRPPGEPAPDLRIVVVNDDGGGIFALLEQGDHPDSAAFERVFGTPHGVDIGALCAATRTPHRVVSTRAELRNAVGAAQSGIEVVELRTDRRGARGLHARLAEAVRRAL
jgi:2-succinyl-5-enolpyruvyl-6-hydroxy-3-cyclohexene-1-carboxylate synthase